MRAPRWARACVATGSALLILASAAGLAVARAAAGA